MNPKPETKWLIVLAVVAFLVFANSLTGDFVYDDKRQIARNPLIQDTTLFGKALTSDVWAFKGDGSLAASNYYRPTFVLWLIFNFQIFGLNPVGWHLLSVLLHVSACLLAFLLLRRFAVSPTIAFSVSLIFAVHPVHTESVAWISGAPDLLFSLFLLGAFWFTENVSAQSGEPVERKNKSIFGGQLIDLIIALIFYAFALGSKEVGILCFPLFFLIFARSATKTNAFKLTLPFFMAAVLYFIARYFALGALSFPTEDSAGLQETLLTAPGMFTFYLRQMIFPFWLGANYPLRPVVEINLPGFVLPLLLSAAGTVFFFFLAKRGFIQKFGFALFMLTLAPAMNATVFPAEQIVHDRYLYLPLLGFLMMMVPFLADLARKFATEKSEQILLVTAILIGLPLGVKTVLYNEVWKTELALWSHSVAIDKNSAFNWSQLGAVLSEEGKIDEAITAYNNSIDVRPTPLAFYGKARNLLAQNRTEEAVFDIKTVIEMPPEKINAYTLYQTYELLAVALVKQKKFDEAQKYLFEARRRLPIYYAALTEKLAVVMYQAGQKTSALGELEAARNPARTELLPESKTVLLRLAMIYAELNRKDEAREVLQEYLKLTTRMQDNITLADRRQALNLLKNLQ